jgi:hypothetical protein
MKRIFLKATALAVIALTISCTSDIDGLNKEMMNDIKEHAEKEIAEAKEAEKEATKEVETLVEETKGDEIQSRYAYDKDWELIKKAIEAKNKSEITDWIHGTRVSAEDITMIFGDPDVLKALKNTKYEDLKPVENEGVVYLMFYYEQTATNDEGDEMGMSISMYMNQGDPNFQIEYVIAAG